MEWLYIAADFLLGLVPAEVDAMVHAIVWAWILLEALKRILKVMRRWVDVGEIGPPLLWPVSMMITGTLAAMAHWQVESGSVGWLVFALATMWLGPALHNVIFGRLLGKILDIGTQIIKNKWNVDADLKGMLVQGNTMVIRRVKQPGGGVKVYVGGSDKTELYIPPDTDEDPTEPRA